LLLFAEQIKAGQISSECSSGYGMKDVQAVLAD